MSGGITNLPCVAEEKLLVLPEILQMCQDYFVFLNKVVLYIKLIDSQLIKKN